MQLFYPEIVKKDFQNHLIEDLHEDSYHADKSAIGSSSIKHILQSPAKFIYEFNKPKDPEEEAEHFRLGRIIHKALLEGTKFKENYVIMPEFTGLTKDGRESAQSKEAKEKREMWILETKEKGKLICTPQERDMVLGIANSVTAHKYTPKILAKGKAEVTGYFRDPETGIKCKIRPDFFTFDLNALVDLKSTRSADRNNFSRHIWEYRYDIQIAMYCYGMEIITGNKVKYPTILAVEKEPPYEASFFICDNTILENGLSDFKRALRVLKECIEKKQWPQRQTTIQEIGLPYWALKGDY